MLRVHHDKETDEFEEDAEEVENPDPDQVDAGGKKKKTKKKAKKKTKKKKHKTVNFKFKRDFVWSEQSLFFMSQYLPIFFQSHSPK